MSLANKSSRSGPIKTKTRKLQHQHRKDDPSSGAIPTSDLQEELQARISSSDYYSSADLSSDDDGNEML